jgi:DNA repair protein RadC
MENVNKPSTSIKNWPKDDRPREKLLNLGPSGLSNAELIAILIRTGTRDKTALAVAQEILKKNQENLDELGTNTLYDLLQIKGIATTKAISILAALELGKRRHNSDGLRKVAIHNSSDVADYLRTTLKDFPYEVFAVLFLNTANKIKHFEIISKGGLTGTIADPRIILKRALEQNATGIILSHNHPSGNLQPSQADESLTLKIKEAAKWMDIRLLDHIIVSNEGYYSFMEEGKI